MQKHPITRLETHMETSINMKFQSISDPIKPANLYWTKKVKDHIFELLPKKIWMQFWPFVFSIFSSICLQYSNVTCRPVHFMCKWLHEWILIQGQKQSVSTCLQSWLWCLLKDICEVFDNCRHSTDISHDEASFNR